jgi:hypothetical protein
MAKRSLLDGPLIPAVAMLVVTGVVAYAAALPAALVWVVVRPHHFHERPFDQDRWLSFAAYEAANGRGEMVDDLVARRLLRLREAATGVVALLGDPDERHGRTRFWLTGRWHGVHDTCLRVAFDRRGKLVRYGLVELRGRASLQSHCAAGTPLGR